MSEAVVPSGSDSAHESALRTSGEVRADYAFSLALGFFANALTVLVLLPLPALTGREIDAGLAAWRAMWFAAPTFLMLAAYTYVRARVPRDISDEALGQIDVRSIDWRPRRTSETTLLRGWSKSIGTAACWLCWLIGVGIVRRSGDQPWDLAIVGASGVAVSIVLLRPFRDDARDNGMEAPAPAAVWRLLLGLPLFTGWLLFLAFSAAWPTGVRMAAMITSGAVLNIVVRRLIAAPGTRLRP